MISQEFVDEFNAEEIMYRLDWMKEPCHSVVLASVENGVSIKPYYLNQKEKRRMITYRAKNFDVGYKECKKVMEDPTYCFAQSFTDMSARKEIEAGGLLDDNSFTGPICPFA